MKLPIVLFHLLLIVTIDSNRFSNQNENDRFSEIDNIINNQQSLSNKEYAQDVMMSDQGFPASFQREKKYSQRKKVLNEVDEEDKPSRRVHTSKANNRSELSNKSNRISQTTPESYTEEASLCINEYDVKAEQLVKVKELKNGARMLRMILIDEPSSSHGLDIKDICMLNCCVQENCDLAMLSGQRSNNGYKCYLFACNGSCTYASHQDYTSMMLKKELPVDDEPSETIKPSKSNEKQSSASSSTTSTTCRSIEFSCRDGTCIPYYDVCNTYEDCPSGIDEAMCSTEFTLHQRTQQENRRKPGNDVETDKNTDDDETSDNALDEDQVAATTVATKPAAKVATTKATSSKSKSKYREGVKQDKNLTSSPFFYNVDLDTQERVSKIQRLKEYLEETKGPEAWYRLFQTLVQHQQQDHSNIDTGQTGSSSSNDDDNNNDDDDNFEDHLLALEQQWIADRQKTKSTTTVPTTTIPTTIKARVKSKTAITTPATTKKMKIASNDNSDLRRPSSVTDDDVTDDDGDDGDQYYWQPTFDDRRENLYNYRQKGKGASANRKAKTKYPPIIDRDTTMMTLLKVDGINSEDFSHTRSLLRESSVIFLFFLGLVFTIILLVLVGFYCRDSWKHGRMYKSRSTDADYLINGLYL